MNGWHESVLFTPLTAAALRGHTKVVELLWKAGANLEHKDPTVINLCCYVLGAMFTGCKYKIFFFSMGGTR